jgi:hypothetical protein
MRRDFSPTYALGLHNNGASFRITAPERRIEMQIMRRRDYKYLIELRQATYYFAQFSRVFATGEA